jgi:MATE family multidrug resistance protein
MFARLGALLLVVVDSAMVGQVGGSELAYYGLAGAPQVPLLLVGIGLLLGIVILTAQADGRGEGDKCGVVWCVGLIHALIYGVVLAGICQFGEWFLLSTGQSSDLAEGAGSVLIMLGWGLPGMLLYIATIGFLEGLHRPLPGMVAMIVGNVLNVGLNWMFIYGHGGFVVMGADGAALSTAIVRWLLFAVVLMYALTRIDRHHYGINLSFNDGWALGKRLRRLGYPMALGHGLESSAFSTVVLFAGLLGTVVVSAFTIAMNLVAMIFMVALGFGTAASVRVANAAARHDSQQVAAAGWVAAILALAVLSIIAVAFLTFSGFLAQLFSVDSLVIAMAAPTIAVAGLALIPDGMQAVLVGGLRGMADVWPATGILLVSFWLVMVPLAYWFGVVRSGGADALMGAVAAAAVVAASSLAFRFHMRSKHVGSKGGRTTALGDTQS